MAGDEDELSPSVLAIAVTCFLALAISIGFFKLFLTNPKRKKSCYLNTESKPQHAFKRILADNSYSQFKHFKLPADDSQSGDEGSNLHPYRGEISKLIKNPNLEFVEFLDGLEKDNLELGSSYIWVDTEDQLTELVEVLSNERVFAVDTEQHSFRSFIGFTALIQISTGIKDYLVDTILLHDMMGLLRPVFADPGICKVFHGADNDVLWLQRDFHIYVVNLFDTAKACDTLSKPQRSLAYLLETYCDVTTNKLLQREDWRQRPLPKEMIEYARMDAHYLLYIASCLCMELKLHRNGSPCPRGILTQSCISMRCRFINNVEAEEFILEWDIRQTSLMLFIFSLNSSYCNILKNISASENSSPGDKFHFLLEASRRSNAICMQLFAKDIEAFPRELAASSLISRALNDQGNISSSLHETKFQELVGRLCLWRDIMARLHDESLRFVLSDNAIIALADRVPATETDICITVSKADLTLVPPQSDSPVVCSHLEDLLYLLQINSISLANIFQLLIQQNLGPAGSCPLSAYNYTFLSKTGLGLMNRSTSVRNGVRTSKIVSKKASRELFVQKFSCKSPVYHNCKIYANDGRLLCYCDRKKLEWYVNRNLARLVEDDPPAIMLLFKPKGRPEDEDNDFYIQSKKNICVGCGEGNHYLRYRIIPSCYRMHFPEHLKSHRSHDIVLLCVDCHEIAHAAAEKYKRQIAAEFGIPLFVQKVIEIDNRTNISEFSIPVVPFERVGVSPLQLRTSAMALLRHGPEMPSERREELMKIVMAYFGGREISEVDLERALVVGMSPHERRRFEKKRGFTFKHLTRCKDQNDGKETKTDWKHDSVDNLMVKDTEESAHLPSSFKGGDVNAAFSADTDDTQSDFKSTPVRKDAYIPGSVKLASETNSPAQGRDDSLKHQSKLSLLGHGPHGKQVIMYLLKEYGEDGIHEFCQRWRQVFVEALHPRFLPAGWDVLHSGKRQFGDFSVYNPTKNHPAPDLLD